MTNPPAAGLPGNATTSSKASIWEDFIDIFHSPSAVFARRENGSVWAPMLIVTVILGLLMYASRNILSPIFDAMFQQMSAKMVEKNPQMTADQLSSMRHMQDIMSTIGIFFFIPLGMFLGGVGVWLIGKIFSASETLKTAVIVIAYSMVPGIVRAVLTILQGLVLDTSSMTNLSQLSFGPARFVDPATASPTMLALLGQLDLFSIWSIVLVAIGVSVTGRISRKEGALVSILVAVLGSLLAVIPAMFA